MALIAPLKTPHISPTTSAQKFATFAAFFIRCIDAFEPFTFFVAFAWNSCSFATVTATPTISNIIPKNITNTKISVAGINGKLFNAFVEINENVIDKINVVIKTVTSHFSPEFSLSLFALSIFVQSLLIYIILDGKKLSKFYGLGLVEFLYFLLNITI